MTLESLLWIASAVCFGCAAVGLESRVNLVAAGLLCSVLTVVL